MTKQLQAPPTRQDRTHVSRGPHIRGYRVFGPDGYVGVVEHVRTEPRPTAVAVLSGLFVPRSRLVPFASVSQVIPKERRVLLGRESRDGSKR